MLINKGKNLPFGNLESPIIFCIFANGVLNTDNSMKSV